MNNIVPNAPPDYLYRKRIPNAEIPNINEQCKGGAGRITDGVSRKEVYKVINTCLCPEGSTKTIALDSADLCSSSICEEVKGCERYSRPCIRGDEWFGIVPTLHQLFKYRRGILSIQSFPKRTINCPSRQNQSP